MSTKNTTYSNLIFETTKSSYILYSVLMLETKNICFDGESKKIPATILYLIAGIIISSLFLIIKIPFLQLTKPISQLMNYIISIFS